MVDASRKGDTHSESAQLRVNKLFETDTQSEYDFLQENILSEKILFLHNKWTQSLKMIMKTRNRKILKKKHTDESATTLEMDPEREGIFATS